MARYLEQANECTDPTTGDYLWIYNASAGATDKDQKVDISRFAIKANTGTFTATQTFAPTSTSSVATVINMPTSTSATALTYKYNSVDRFYYTINATQNQILQAGDDLGNNTTGPQYVLGRNTNATNSSAGSFGVTRKGGLAVDYLWSDNTGVWRTNTTAPTGTTDSSSGTVIGTQTSSLDSKNIIEPFTDYNSALNTIIDAPIYNFTYKSGAFNGEQFTGLITDYAPTFGMDRDEAHPAGKSLNTISAHGYTFAAIKALAAQVATLQQQNAELIDAVRSLRQPHGDFRTESTIEGRE